ncbi:MAG: flagellar biosynthetic protein FliR [Candidatus Endobugula sp.]|jgi:flagellar biosynthetic protein FliR
MLAFTEPQLMYLVSQYILPLTRISAFFMAAPIFGTRIVSAKIRLTLSIAITIIIVPLLPPASTLSGLSLSMMLVVGQQILIGVALAFIFQVVFQLFVLAGMFIAMKMGLGFASMNDPSSGMSVSILSQFYLLTTTLLFLSFNGHLVLVSILVDSFSMLPISASGITPENIYRIVELGGWMFGSALTISLPVLTALLLVNIAFGVMSRSAPQMNIFAVGFPLTLLFGLFIMWVGFNAFLPSFELFVDQGMKFAISVLQG